ncbi:hypothetical protein BGX21_004957, partial [Mortierella sp. AD011]
MSNSEHVQIRGLWTVAESSHPYGCSARSCSPHPHSHGLKFKIQEYKAENKRPYERHKRILCNGKDKPSRGVIERANDGNLVNEEPVLKK